MKHGWTEVEIGLASRNALMAGENRRKEQGAEKISLNGWHNICKKCRLASGHLELANCSVIGNTGIHIDSISPAQYGINLVVWHVNCNTVHGGPPDLEFGALSVCFNV